ncbi:MAG TPA: hypothetical protein VJT70_03365 [Sphingomicrobium sp.]|nr:hypothetical protein [Sphingomicrobium sp.]
MFLPMMRHENVTITAAGIDWKALGYIVSIVSVFLLGAIAWPKAGDPGWHEPVLIAGMATSIAGMAFRYKAHLDQRRELRKTKAEARKD